MNDCPSGSDEKGCPWKKMVDQFLVAKSLNDEEDSAETETGNGNGTDIGNDDVSEVGGWACFDFRGFKDNFLNQFSKVNKKAFFLVSVISRHFLFYNFLFLQRYILTSFSMKKA